MAYNKSYSNYVLRKQHQLTADGTVYERDMYTIGGVDHFAPNTTPLFRSGNFIITVNSNGTTKKDYKGDNWVSSLSGDTFWDGAQLSAYTAANDDTMKISLNQDLYHLQDFAYYGSCAELIRCSLVDILSKFPGELHAPQLSILERTNTGATYITTGLTVYNKKTKIGENNEFLFHNPFNIDIHTEHIDDELLEAQPLRYFAYEGWKNYQFINEDGAVQEIKNVVPNVTGTSTCVGVLNGTVIITLDDDTTKEVLVYSYGNNKVVYLTTELNWSLRPKEEHLVSFFKSLDAFQKVLLNRHSTPKYSALFEVMTEDKFGYSTKLQKFTFPTTHGGYNLAIDDDAYKSYLNSLIEVAELYDTVYSDNLSRVMTHESIKNLDWTYNRMSTDGDDADDYIDGLNKVQKTLRLIGREFDEIKNYIDSVQYANVVTYNNLNNMADYFLTDKLSGYGWEIKNIYPFKEVDTSIVEDLELTVQPYNTPLEDVSYYMINGQLESLGTTEKYHYDDNKTLYTRINEFVSPKEYTMNEVNNHFLRMLYLNSRAILKHKGTIEGIEMILGLLGLRSERYIENLSKKDENAKADYAITEYTTFTTGITDTKRADSQWYQIDWYNYTKTLGYSSKSAKRGLYEAYRGLPVRYREIDEGGNQYRLLYPYFSPNKEIDGRPYYQMGGGWMKKPFQFNKADNLVDSSYYTYTLDNVMVVDTIQELLRIPYRSVADGMICKVKDFNTDFVIVDDVCYPIEKETGKDGRIHKYFSVTIYNNTIKIGNKVFLDEVIVSSPYGSDGTMLYYFNEYKDGSKLKIYILEDAEGIHYDHKILVEQFGLTIPVFYLLIGGNMLTFNSNANETTSTVCANPTSYFKLGNKQYKNTIGGRGWIQMGDCDPSYQKLLCRKNNFEGNNPHMAVGEYNMGMEYISYFTQLFKYALENNTFDKRCYDDDTAFNEALSEIQKLGFVDLKEDSNADGIGYKIYEDTKVHYVGNKLPKELNDEPITFEEFGEVDASYDAFPSNITRSTNCLDQIMNIKVVDIKFNPKYETNDYKKFMDKVVFKYLEQMLPINTILRIRWEQ